MSSPIILERDSDLYQSFAKIAGEARMVFFAGLSGVGKSLLLQQLTFLAHEFGRNITHLQWDSTRLAFENDDTLSRYPEVDGVTHPVLRKAVGAWARAGVLNWHETHPQSTDMLIGEVPLVGNRLIELVQKHGDGTEAVLTSNKTVFVLPVPSRMVRSHIAAARAATIANPRHVKESKDAPPNVMASNWQSVWQIGVELGLVAESADFEYDPAVYQGVYKYLLQHRHVVVCRIDTLLKPSGSAYDFGLHIPEWTASANEVEKIMAEFAGLDSAEIKRQVANWYKLN